MAFIHLIYDLDVVKRCYTCSHPNRAAIDAELLQGVSFRTVAGMYGLSPSALHRHRNEHMDEPTVGDLLEPADQFDAWRRFDGREWRRCPTPQEEDLIELRCRPHQYRSAFSIDINAWILRRTYRIRRSRSVA